MTLAPVGEKSAVTDVPSECRPVDRRRAGVRHRRRGVGRHKVDGVAFQVGPASGPIRSPR